MKTREAVQIGVFIGAVLAWMLGPSTATGQVSPRALPELFIQNRDDVTHVFDASSEGRVQWRRNGSMFEITTANGEVDTISIAPGYEKGWDFVDGTGSETGEGILAYSKYRIWTDDGQVWLDYRDTYYITDNFGEAGVDVHVYYNGSTGNS